jgi:hypothetical protein
MKGDAAMKKNLFACLLVLALFVGFSPHSSLAFMPEEFMVQSGTTNVGSYVVTEGGFLYGVWVSSIGSGVTICAYDVSSGATTSAATLFPSTYLPLSTTNPYSVISFDPPVPFNNGVRIDVWGTLTTGYKVYYRYRRDH